MGIYTVQANDNLWNIAKNQYKDLKSNSDIQKAVDAIVNNNNIKNPDLIFPQTDIQLPDVNSIFGNGKKDVVEKSDIFNEFTQWQDDHGELMQNSSDWSDYLENRDGIGTSFDFMEGKDVRNEQEYSEQTLKLGKGEIEAKDGNNDGKVDFSEYFTQEIQNEISSYKEMIKSGELPEQEAIDTLKDVYIQSNKVFNIIDVSMGDGDNALDEKEFQSYYQHLDEYTADENGETLRDGKIDIDFVTEYPEFLAQQVQTDDKVDKSAEKIVKSLLSID